VATVGTTAPTTRRAAAAAKQSSTNSRAPTTAAGKQATTSSKQKGTTAAAATGTNTTRPSNQKGRISATAAVAAAIDATTTAPTKQKGGGTTYSNDPDIPERMPTEVSRITTKPSTHQVAEKSPRRAAAETLVFLNVGVRPSDDVDEAEKEIFNDNDVNDFLNLDEGIDGWTSPLGLGIDDGLKAGGELKNPPEIKEVASAASPCSLYSDDDGRHGEYDDSDDTSYYESNSEDDQKPVAKTGPAKKVPGGAFSPKVEALGILKQFIKKQFSPMLPHLFTQPSGLVVPSLPSIVCSPMQGGQLLEGSTPTKEVTGAQYDNELFEDDIEEEDLSYYRSSTQGKRGCKLSAGGPPKPDTTNMTAAESDMALAEWMIIQKAHTDKKQCLLRMELGVKTGASD
jgi:hypothetical protein